MAEAKKKAEGNKERKPSPYAKYTQDFIVDYCQKHKKVGWLQEQVQAMDTDKKGKKHKRTFISIRANFVKEFFPDEVPESAKKNTSFYDRVMALKK